MLYDHALPDRVVPSIDVNAHGREPSLDEWATDQRGESEHTAELLGTSYTE